MIDQYTNGTQQTKTLPYFVIHSRYKVWARRQNRPLDVFLIQVVEVRMVKGFLR